MTTPQRNESTVGVTPDAMDLVGCASHTDGPQADPAVTDGAGGNSRTRRIHRHIHSSMKRLMSWVVLVVGIGVQGTPYLAALALASPLAYTGNVKASEGRMDVYYTIDLPYQNSKFRLIHSPDREEGFDNRDFVWHPLLDPSGVGSKIVSYVDGKELRTDGRPTDSTSSIDVHYSIFTSGGKPIPPIENPYVWVNIDHWGDKVPFENKDVYLTVEGVTYDAKTLSAEGTQIPLSSLEGVATISFSWISDPDPDPEPNEPPVFGLPGAETLPSYDLGNGFFNLEARVSDDGGEDGEGGFDYWKYKTPFSYNRNNFSKTSSSSGLREGDFFSEVVETEGESVYGYSAFVRNSAGEGSGSEEKFNSFYKDTLLIRNRLSSLSEERQGIFAFAQKEVGSPVYEPNEGDALYSSREVSHSRIVALIANGDNGFYELSRDVRGASEGFDDPNGTALIETGFWHPDPNAVISGANFLDFWLPDVNASFAGKSITIQRVGEEGVTHPVHDVRQVIRHKNGAVRLADWVEQAPDVATFFEVSTEKDILDVNGDGVVCAQDYAAVLSEMGKEGPSRADIASPLGTVLYRTGIPDGKVDETDARAFREEWLRRGHEDIFSDD